MERKIPPYITILLIGVLLGILIALSLILIQLRNNNKIAKINLTYSICKDIDKWEKEHPEASRWISKLDSPLADKYEKFEFDDYLGYYEALYYLKLNGSVDEGLVYELFSNELESIYEANNFELKGLILKMRKEENDPEIYIGVESLYKDIKSKRKYLKK